MTGWIRLLTLIAAALHVTWNALVKTAGDRLATLGFIALATSLIGLAMLPFVALPRVESWLWIAASMLLKYAHCAFIFSPTASAT